MRYAIFTDIHANLEALESVLAKIDELAQQAPIDQIWFLGDLVGYGPNPNECIVKLRERTDVIIAGNHDWAAVGKIDLEDFSDAARISALWTAEQLTAEHRAFLANLPERIAVDECLLVHGSPYGPLWEYLTSEVLAERSFQHFANRFCFVGHTHVPIIFQQPDNVANAPTIPLETEDFDAFVAQELTDAQNAAQANGNSAGTKPASADDDDTTELSSIRPQMQTKQEADQAKSPHSEVEELQNIVADAVEAITEIKQQQADDMPALVPPTEEPTTTTDTKEVASTAPETSDTENNHEQDEEPSTVVSEPITPEETIQNAEEQLNEEIEELLALLGLSQSMIHVTNEMVVPPEGLWQAPEGYRAIVNPGGVGQPRDGDTRAAFMIYDTEAGFTFYRISYPFEKTQEKIIKAKLPHYLATRLAYGR